jgi:hypothetical protein
MLRLYNFSVDMIFQSLHFLSLRVVAIKEDTEPRVPCVAVKSLL